METYLYTSLAAITGLGLIVGAIIAKETVEEIKNGLKFVKIFMISLTYISLFITLLGMYKNQILAATIPTIIIVAIYYLPRKLFAFSKDYLFIILLTLSFYFSIKENRGYVVPSLIFFNLTVIGSLQYFHKYKTKETKQMYFSFLTKYLVFVFLSVLFRICSI